MIHTLANYEFIPLCGIQILDIEQITKANLLRLSCPLQKKVQPAPHYYNLVPPLENSLIAYVKKH